MDKKLEEMIRRAKEHQLLWLRFYKIIDELIEKDHHGLQRFLDIMTKEM